MYVIGIDVGGTFTDCVAIDDAGHVSVDKAFTTPDDLSQGILAALQNLSGSIAKSVEDLLGEAQVFALGTTSMTNRVVARKGAPVGVLISKGHEDVMRIGRIMARTEGLREDQRYDLSIWNKPEPLASRGRVQGVSERIDCKGDVVVPLNRDEVIKGIAELERNGVEAVAVVFLWSFLNPKHEQEVREIIKERAPQMLVCLSSEISPTLGEYERANTTLLNAFLAPGSRHDLETLENRLKERGLKGRILAMQSHGGLGWREEVELQPVRALAAGPVGGVMGSAKLASLLQDPNVICTDMGGTSFDVGLVIDSQPRFANEAVIERHRIRVPTVEVTSIGAGGGSIAYVDSTTSELRVGPESAGSIPGPVCYRRGGVDPTVTDADVVLGRIDPGSFFGGRNLLDKDGALAAVEEKIARPLGMDPVEAAKGILDIVDARMADLVRTLTVERGYDPRNFDLFAYGGAGPTHVGAYSRDIGVKKVVIPMYASVLSAFGIAASDLRRHHSRAQPMREPFENKKIRSALGELEKTARLDWTRSGFAKGEASYLWFVDMRFRYQVHEIRVPVLSEQAADLSENLVERFVNLYEETFGAGSAIREAGTEILTFHVVSVAPAAKMAMLKAVLGSGSTRPTPQATRRVYFTDSFEETPVFEIKDLSAGHAISGPAIIEASNTTIVVHPDQGVELDEYMNVILDVK
jgi:N-methylhydantoinase A